MSGNSFYLFNDAVTVLAILINSAALSLFVFKLLPSKKRKLKALIIFAVYIGIMALCDALSAPSGVSLAALIAAAALFAPLLSESRSEAVLYALLYLNARAQSGIISQSIYHGIESANPYPEMPLEAVYSHSAKLISVYIVCFTLLLSVMLILLNKRLRKYPIGGDKYSAWYLCLYPLIGVIFGAVVSRIIIEPGDGELLMLFGRHPSFQAVLPILAAMFYIGTYIMVVWAQKLAYAKENQARITIEAQMTKNLESRICELYSGYEKLRSVKHDAADHLNTLTALIANGNKEEALSYIRSMSEDARENFNVASTGNPVADAVISEFSGRFESADIKFECEFCYDASIKIQPYDLAVILSNLLNNAYEACLKLAESNRFVHLKSRRNGKFFIIETENPALSTVIEENGTILSTKSCDGSFHGIGLKSVSAKVQKYNGEALYKYENGFFLAVIMLQEDEKLNSDE